MRRAMDDAIHRRGKDIGTVLQIFETLRVLPRMKGKKNLCRTDLWRDSLRAGAEGV
jgi:hypothetical protein